MTKVRLSKVSEKRREGPIARERERERNRGML